MKKRPLYPLAVLAMTAGIVAGASTVAPAAIVDGANVGVQRFDSYHHCPWH